MKNFVTCSSIVISFLFAAVSVAQDRDDFVSDGSHVVGTHQPDASDYSPESIATSANAFLESLDEKQRSRVQHEIDSAERREWTNLPAPENAGGLRLGDMTETQVRAACDMMAAIMSEQGYQKMVGIMLADDQLLDNGRPRRGFGTENFSIVIFGTPSPAQPWSFQLDGHHVGVNYSMTGDQLTMSPSFIGTQPQSFELAGKTIRPLTREIDDAYRLVATLNDEQRKAAVIREERGDLVAGPGNDNRVPEARGVSCSEFDESQREILMRLISQWVNDMPASHAEKRMAELTKELNEMKFEWNGAVDVGSDISYRIQGPTLLIEYACQSLGGDPQQHLHTMYRNLKNEYGLQIKGR